MLPFLKRHIKKIELLHNFSFGKKGMEFFGLANHHLLDIRMVIDNNTKENIIHQYRDFNVPEKYNEMVRVEEYGVDIPQPAVKSNIPPLKVLYAGRGTRQKRIWLLNKIAEHFILNKSPVDFTFAGSMSDELTEIVKTKSKVLGVIGDQQDMNGLFASNHVIILTSAFEGFPVVVKEGMSYGCVPVVTALPGNKIHLQHLSNALLMENPEDENKVIQEAINNIELLLSRPDLLKSLSENAFNMHKKISVVGTHRCLPKIIELILFYFV